MEPRAVYWDQWNKTNLSADGPLWVALGDSVTQGIGSSNPQTSYVHIILERLRMRTGKDWRLINLSMSGGRFLDVVERQLPIIEDYQLQPSLVTTIIGSNDLMWRRDKESILNDAKRTINSLPLGSYLSKVSAARKGKRNGSSAINHLAPIRGIHLFNA